MFRKIIILLFVPVVCYCQVKPVFEIEAGYNKFRASIYKPDNFKYAASTKDYPIFTDVILGVKYKSFVFIQHVENYMSYRGGKTFTVNQIRFVTGVFYEKDRLKIGYEHMCFHPIIAGSEVKIDYFYISSYDKITIKYKIL